MHFSTRDTVGRVREQTLATNLVPPARRTATFARILIS